MSNEAVRGVRILFSMRHLGSFRMYESVIRTLAERGHAVHIVVDRGERMGWRKGLDQLLEDCPDVSWSWAVSQRRNAWFEFGRAVRIWLDLLRYFDPRYDTTPILRQRAEDRVPRALVAINRLWPLTTRGGRSVLRVMLRAAERALPRSRELDAFIAEQKPDVLLITPLIYLGSPQLEMLRSAKAMGVRTALCVGSWDHLSSKALIRDRPMRVLVWNETQRSEALDLHHIPPEQVVVTGAQCYDQWFGRQPSRSREDFCRAVGLDAQRPFLLYVCSALFWGSPPEPDFIVEWLDALRHSGSERLRSVGVLLRPHPARVQEWDHIDLSRFENVVLYGSNPVDPGSRNDYFESLYYSGAVVGLNTSAFLEAAVVGRPVHTIMPPVYFDNQEGTLHFHYLLHVGGGLLRPARSFEEHMGQLDDTLAGSHPGNEGFVRAFIRPHGLDVPATATFVDAVEQLAAVPAPAPAPIRLGARLLRVPLFPLALLARVTLGDDQDAVDRTTREIRREHERAKKARLLDEHKLRKVHAAESFEQERERRKAAVLREREDQRRARLAARERQQRERERQHAETEREKLLLKARKARDKEARLKRKRRVAWRQRLMERLGLA